MAGGVRRSASLPIVPLTQGGLLIPFRPAPMPGVQSGQLPRAPGHPSVVQNFTDIQRQIQLQRAQLAQALQQQNYSRVPSPPVISAAPANRTVPYASGNLFSGVTPNRTPFPPLTPGAYSQATSIRPNYIPPSYAGSSGGSVLSAQRTPYHALRP
jgi:hypothetical protein